MQYGNYIDPSVYYETAAEMWAKHFNCKFEGQLSFDLLGAVFNVPVETLEEIELDFFSFSERVNDYLYAISMENNDA